MVQLYMASFTKTNTGTKMGRRALYVSLCLKILLHQLYMQAFLTFELAEKISHSLSRVVTSRTLILFLQKFC